MTLNLTDLEEALDGGMPGEHYLLPKSGRVIFIFSDEFEGEMDEADEEALPDDEEYLPIDKIESNVHFRWMEEFIHTIHSITAQHALRDALRHKKPFRNFRDALLEFPIIREKWFQFEKKKVREEALSLLESFDWEILEIIDSHPPREVVEETDPAENVPPTEEEHDYILRAASQIAAKGGRNQLSLLLKGSRNKSVLKHGLDRSPVYGKLSYLTIEEIENRVDRLIRAGELQTEFFGDLPLILLTDRSWSRIRPKALLDECHQACSADERTLAEILRNWCNRRRDEQRELIDTISSIESGSAKRVLLAWHALAGKEIRAAIEATLKEAPPKQS